LRIEIKIFVTMFCLSVVVFSATLLLYYPCFVPLLPPPELSLENIVNFYYGMSLYFVFIGAISVLVYFLVKPHGNIVRVFIITFLAMSFWFLGVIGLYHAAFEPSPVDPLWMIRIWQDWHMVFIFTAFSFSFLIVSTIAAIVYKVSTYVWRMIAERKNRGEVA